MFMFDQLASQMVALPRGGWTALGLIEMSCAILLIVPAAAKWRPVLTPLAATVLALEAVVLSAVYARYSLQIAMTNPLVWSFAMGLAVAFVAYGRYALRPTA